uniref:Uncharacterized protein n=1 Tax=Mesocestoides corti TaxID=53468 RepID=A0A5K3FI72_MESCO
MIRTLKALANANGGKLPQAIQAAQKQPSVPPKATVLNPETRSKLIALFDKIFTSKDESYIEELYDFTVQYPDLDLQPFLADSTPFFQTYIHQALYNVGLKRAQTRVKQASNANVNGVRETQPPSFTEELTRQPANPKLFMDRLATLRKELGLESKLSETTQDVESEGGERSSGAVGMENTLRDAAQARNEGGASAPTGGLEGDPAADSGGGGMSRNELMAIRRRLEMIKNAQSRG